MVALQVYVDDSATDDGDRRLFLAGYINTADKWSRFSDAWAEELRTSPSIEYLKMAEAQNLRNQFRGWTASDRNDKIRALARVIRHFKPASIHSSVSRVELKSIISPVAPYGLGHPYLYCFTSVMVTLANSILEHGLPKVPIDFIFDDQEGLGDEAKFFYRIIRDSQPAAVRVLLSKDPVFKNDKHVAPLQAADMLAWHIRRNHVDNPTAFQVPNFLSADGRHMAVDIDTAQLQRIAAGYAQVPGTQLLKTRGAWKRTMRDIEQIEQTGRRPSLRAVRIGNTLLYWRRRGWRMLSRILARFFRN